MHPTTIRDAATQGQRVKDMDQVEVGRRIVENPRDPEMWYRVRKGFQPFVDVEYPFARQEHCWDIPAKAVFVGPVLGAETDARDWTPPDQSDAIRKSGRYFILDDYGA